MGLWFRMGQSCESHMTGPSAQLESLQHMRKGVLLVLLHEKKKKEKVWRKRDRRISTGPNIVAQRICRRQIFGGRVVGLKGKQRSAPLLFWLLLLWSPLVGVGSPLSSILFPHGCHRAHPPFLQTCLVKPVPTCYTFSTEHMYASVFFAKVKVPSKESVMQKTFWMVEQGTAINYLIQFTRVFGVGGWHFRNVMFTKMVKHWSLCNKCFT